MELRLRFREHDGGHEPPDVEAFSGGPRGASPSAPQAFSGGPRGASPSAPQAFVRRRRPSPAGAEGTRPGPIEPSSEGPEPIGVLPGGERLGPRAPFVMFFRHIGYGIPAPGEVHPSALPDLESWRLRPTVFGWLASVPPPRSGSPRSRAVSWIVAACLPLVLPVEAMAAPRPELPPVQVPEPSTPSDTEAAPEPDPEPGAPPIEGSSAETSDPSPVSLPAPMPALEQGTSDVDQATIDAAWEGVDGFDVELELKGGGTMRGRVGAVQPDTFTLIQAKSGAVLVLPKSSVVSLRVRIPPPLPSRNGVGALVGGGVLTAIGAPVFISGVTILSLCPSCASVHLPLLLVGGGALGGGIPLLVRGARQRRAYQEAMQERAVSPVVLRTPHGWTGGVRFRF